MTVSGTIGKQLVEIERELERCVKEARHHRDGLITMTSFDSAETLSRIDDADIEGPISKLELVRDRVRALLADKKRIGAA